MALGAATLLLSGCGTPGTPQPPSLKLPEPVTDLTAVRNGSTVNLTWTMPRRTTDKLRIESQIKGPLTARVCRRGGAKDSSGECQTAGEIAIPGEAEGRFRETLPIAEAQGQARPLLYFVELKNPKGRSAGLSNAAEILAGAAPEPIAGLTAEVRADGVALHWAASGGPATAVRLHRKLLSAQAPPAARAGAMQPAPEAPERDLLVEAPANGKALEAALDSSARFGQIYEYTAQRVVQASIDGKTQELAGESSAPVRVDVVDTFAPAIPRSLVAVFAPEDRAIDLSWEPDSETDLAGYIVYRAAYREMADGAWTRISGPQPLTGPAFRDSAIAAGETYRYTVSAIDLKGNESRKSQEARESFPASGPNP
jgi:hypothetical protein